MTGRKSGLFQMAQTIMPLCVAILLTHFFSRWSWHRSSPPRLHTPPGLDQHLGLLREGMARIGLLDQFDAYAFLVFGDWGRISLWPHTPLVTTFRMGLNLPLVLVGIGDHWDASAARVG